MNGCETYQEAMSALLDGELTGPDLAATIRHLAACETCLQEFETFQALQQRVNRDLRPPAVPPRLWPAIAREHPPREARRVRLPARQTAFRVLRIAAVVALCFGAGYWLSRPVWESPAGPETPIVLASDGGAMSDQHFLALTRELLTADPVYHQKMYLILETLLSRYDDGALNSLREADPSPLITPVTEGEAGEKETYRF
ncbi:MAG: hypothetical protein C4524_06985 [Candidatus Zixiibacteriota bacterium]|nr:MAG: hypothetical protein C4524_06985 [candidate division Zixibacteria bacterium]